MTTTAIATDDGGFHFEEYRSIRIGFRRADRYVDATALCRAAGRAWNDYYAKNEGTATFLRGLADATGIPVVKSPASRGLVELGRGRGGHTWVHPRVAWHLGQWADPGGLAVFVTDVMDKLSQGLLPATPSEQQALATQYATKADIAELRLVVDNRARETHSAIEALGWRLEDRTRATTADVTREVRENAEVTHQLLAPLGQVAMDVEGKLVPGNRFVVAAIAAVKPRKEKRPTPRIQRQLDLIFAQRDLPRT